MKRKKKKKKKNKKKNKKIFFLLHCRASTGHGRSTSEECESKKG